MLIQIIQLEEQREKKNFKKYDSINLINICIMGRLEGEEREKETEKFV